MIKRLLDTAVSIVTLVAAVGIIYVLVADIGGRRGWFRPSKVQAGLSGYAHGDKMDKLPGIQFQETKSTLLVFFRSHCQFCMKSTGYYQRLVEARDRRRAPVRIVAVAFTGDSDAEKFVQDQGWRPDGLVRVQLSGVKVRAAPVVLLVDSRGAVVESWLGETTEDTYRDIVRTALTD